MLLKMIWWMVINMIDFCFVFWNIWMCRSGLVLNVNGFFVFFLINVRVLCLFSLERFIFLIGKCIFEFLIWYGRLFFFFIILVKIGCWCFINKRVFLNVLIFSFWNWKYNGMLYVFIFGNIFWSIYKFFWFFESGCFVVVCLKVWSFCFILVMVSVFDL